MNQCGITEGFTIAREITRRHAKTFYCASHFLPKDKRNASYAVYAICRTSDNAVDRAGGGKRTVYLNKIKQKIDSAYGNTQLKDGVLLAFRKTVLVYDIPKDYFDQLLEGMHMDLNKNRYGNFEELYEYCYRAAGVVGLIMLKIFGFNKEQAKQYAVDLGIAMQLTNILRDIKEDYRMGRIYLPQNELGKFNVTENDISKGRVNKPFIAFMRFQIQRARNYYAESTKGIGMIGDKRSRLVVYMMKDMYAGILGSIEKNNFDVYSQRARLNSTRKMFTALNVLLKAQFL